MLKILCALLILVGGVMLGLTLRDQIQGVVSYRPEGSSVPTVVTARTHPTEFQRVMNGYWAQAAMPGVVALVVLLLVRRREAKMPPPAPAKLPQEIDEMEMLLDEEARKYEPPEARKFTR